MITLGQYLFTIRNSAGLTRTLGRIDLCRDADGRPCFTAGNSAVVFRIRHRGRTCALRCYTHPPRHLAEIYGERLLRNELYVYRDAAHGEWTDVVLDEWIEGDTLHDRIAAADAAEFARLAASFDRMAAELAASECAHGDLKPENIVVTPDGTMRTIDRDAMFLPSMAHRESPELGTAAFQHPARTASDFDARIDDFPAALISTALHALALEPGLRERYGVHDTLLIDPQRLDADPALDAILALFERQGDALRYRIARLLRAGTLRLPRLAALLDHAVRPPRHVGPEPPELYESQGLWGYRPTIPPLYDCGFEFTEGLAAVRLGRTWHYIDTEGRTAIRCPGCEAVKPFRNGRAVVLRDGVRRSVGRDGKFGELEY